MKILKENKNLVWLIDDKGKKLFSAENVQKLIEKLNKTLTIKKVVKNEQ